MGTRIHRKHTGQAVGLDWKGSLLRRCSWPASPPSFWHRGMGIAFFSAVALMWLVPDRRSSGSSRTCQRFKGALLH